MAVQTDGLTLIVEKLHFKKASLQKRTVKEIEEKVNDNVDAHYAWKYLRHNFEKSNFSIIMFSPLIRPSVILSVHTS